MFEIVIDTETTGRDPLGGQAGRDANRGRTHAHEVGRTYYNQLRSARHIDRTEAMFEAATQRMRPMLMTAMSACIGLLPAAISTGIGSQVQRPLATVIVGGMLIEPIMLLVVVPALRMLFLGTEGDPEPAAPADQPVDRPTPVGA